MLEAELCMWLDGDWFGHHSCIEGCSRRASRLKCARRAHAQACATGTRTGVRGGADPQLRVLVRRLLRGDVCARDRRQAHNYIVMAYIVMAYILMARDRRQAQGPV